MGPFPHPRHRKNVAPGAGVRLQEPKATLAIDGDVDAEFPYRSCSTDGPVDDAGNGQGDVLNLCLHRPCFLFIQSETFLQQRRQSLGFTASVDIRNKASLTTDAGSGARYPKPSAPVPLHKNAHVENAFSPAKQVEARLDEPRLTGCTEQPMDDAVHVPGRTPMNSRSGVGEPIRI